MSMRKTCELAQAFSKLLTRQLASLINVAKLVTTVENLFSARLIRLCCTKSHACPDKDPT